MRRALLFLVLASLAIAYEITTRVEVGAIPHVVYNPVISVFLKQVVFVQINHRIIL